MRYLILAAVLAAGPALADDMVAKGETTTIRLMDAPCEQASFQAMLVQVKPEPAKRAVVVHKGRPIPACWVAHQESGNVAIIDADGDMGLIPMAEFKREAGI